ncbi:MAG: hypothetical protein NTV94_07525, partial [Planctomycetota bacterium]|nr:hypothetical protein [Planctomycetota bacterium]
MNRRTVVDQASDEAARYLRLLTRDDAPAAHDELQERAASRALITNSLVHADAIETLRLGLARLAGQDPTSTVPPIAVSTLRGELADNGEWKKNPARPAIIIGTIDMVGSKLLFSGYGDGRYGRAHHAGLIGQDTLIIHDEAHLSPAFDELLKSVAAVQRSDGEFRP